MNLTRVKEVINELLSKIRNAGSTGPESLLKRFRISETINNFISGLGKLMQEKKRLILFGFGGLVVLLFLIIILTLNSGRIKNTSPQIADVFIPNEELFHPAEPDFVPEFILEREPRHFWSLEDIRSYWRTPVNPDFWRGEIKSAIDILMEGVP